MRRLRSMLFLYAAALALAGCAPPDPIHVGFLGGLSGRVSDLGIGGLQGARLAVELRNQKGGIHGRAIELIEADDQQQAVTALAAIDSLLERRVVAVVGPMTSAIAIAVVPRINQSKLLLVSPTVTTADLLGMDDYFFRVIPATRDFVRTNADYYYRRLGLRRLRLIYDLRNQSYCESWLEDFAQAFAAQGGTLLAPLTFTSSDETAFAPLAREALAERPDGILLLANSVDAAMLSQAIRKLDRNVRLGTSEWAATERLAELGGPWVEGITVAQFYQRDDDTPAFRAFRDAYRTRYGRDPGYPETFSFDATNVVLDALDAQTAKQSLKEALLARKRFAGTQRTIEFDANGDTLGETFMVRIQNGVFTPVGR